MATSSQTLTLETPQTANWFLANNRISGWGYDNAGNVTTSGMGRQFSYDAENRQITAFVNNQSTVYTYDGDGRRVRKTVCPVGIAASACSPSTAGAVLTVFVYDAFGNLAQEYSTAAAIDTGTKYIHADHLGSTRLTTSADGTVAKCYDYLPFGEELGNGTGGRTSACFGGSQYPMPTDKVSIKFTSKERDAETGLDYFGARYMSSAQGRFTSPDGPLNDQDPSDPQSWNLYGYVRNNPLRAIDPNGQECVTLDGGGKGDDGKGNFCNDKSLLTTHGVTVNGTTGDATYAAFGNAVLMGNIDLSGRKDQINSAPDELLNALPVAKAALVIGKVGLTLGPLAVLIGKDALQHVLARHAANTVAQNVSKFAAGLSKDAVEGLINAALKDGAVTQGSKVAFYDLDLGVNIGTNQAGQATNTIRVLVDNATGKAIAAYPK